MATYARKLLSASTSGKPILIAATATAGTLIHTAVAGAAAWDEIYLWLSNTSGTAVPVTVEWGGATAPDSHLVDAYSIPANSPPIPVVTGQVLNGGLTCRIFAGTTNVITATGFINAIS